jgi:hypothetical protein
MRKKQGGQHAHVGALSDARNATTREEDRARKHKQRVKLKAQGLKETVSDASKAKRQLKERTGN